MPAHVFASVVKHRLAKLLSQVKCGPRLGMHQIDPMYRPWAVERKESQVEEMETVEKEEKIQVEDSFTDFKYWDESPLISVQLEVGLLMAHPLLCC